MMNKLVYIAVLALLLFSSCHKKKELETLPESNDPVFTLTGDIDEQPIEYRAGVDGMIMKNGLQTRNGVSYFYSEMTDGYTSFRLGLFDGHVEIPNFEASLKQGDTLYLAQKIAETLADFSKDYLTNSDNIESVMWYVNDSPFGTPNLAIQTPGKYKVCGEYIFNGDPTIYKVCNEILVGFTPEFEFTIEDSVGLDGIGYFNLKSPNNDVASAQWFVDGVKVSDDLSFTTPLSLKSYLVHVKVISKTGAIQEKSILVDGSLSDKYVQDVAIFISKYTGKTWDYGVGMDIVRNGETFSTFEVKNYKSKMFIDKVEHYEVNSEGKNVYKITGKIDAMLSNASQTKNIHVNLTAVFAYILKD